jgi:cell division protein FtsB
MNEQFNAKKRQFFKESPLSKAGIFIKIALILIIIIILVLSANSLMQYSEILNETTRVEQQIEDAQERVDELEYLIQIPKNDKSLIIRIAREKLGLVLPEEIVYYSDRAE